MMLFYITQNLHNVLISFTRQFQDLTLSGDNVEPTSATMFVLLMILKPTLSLRKKYEYVQRPVVKLHAPADDSEQCQNAAALLLRKEPPLPTR